MKGQSGWLSTTKNSLLPSKGITRRRYFIFYTLIFVVMAFAVFGIFLINGKSFIWSEDGWTQHYKALVYYAQWLRSIIRDFFSQGTLNIPTFSFSIGYGSDILSTLSYYVIGDPLTIFAVFVPTRFMEVFYDFLVIFRLFLSGVAFSLFCFYKEDQKAEQTGVHTQCFSKVSILTGSFVYVFCGFALFASVRHPYFINPMIYFPLIMIGVEKILDGKRPWLLVSMVFITAVSNFYFFYMIVILTVLYVIWRLISRYHWSDLKSALLKLVKIAGSAVLGTCLGAVILSPVILLFLDDARSASDYVYNFLYSLGDYESEFGAFISLNSINNWTAMGYATIGLTAIFLLFIQKKHRDLKIAFLVLTVMLLLPAAGHIMNGFSYVSNRWIWGYSFLIAYIVVVKWKELFELTTKEKWRMTVCMAVYLLLCLLLVKSRSVSVFFALAMMFLSLAVIGAVKDRFGIRWSGIALTICVLVNIVGNALFYYFPHNGNYVGQFMDSSEVYSGLEETEAVAVREASNDTDEFFRYSGDSTSKNSTLYSGLHDTQYFWSLSDGNITDFRVESGISAQIPTFDYSTLDSRTYLSALANIKYYVQDDEVPYGYTYLDTFSVSSKSESAAKEFIVWEDDYYLPFGYTYDSFVSREDYENMSPLKKQEALMEGCVIESNVADGEETMLTFTGESLPFTLDASDGLTYANGCIDVTKANSTLTLTFNGIVNSETYLYITGMSYTGYSPRELYSDEEWDNLSTYEKNEVNYQERYYEEPTTLYVNVSTQDTEGESSTATLTYCTPYYSWYSNRTDFMVNLGYDENGQISMTLKFPTTGVYTFDSLEVLCQPMDHYVEQVTALSEDVMENVDFHENSAHATNLVTGSIRLDSPKYLLLTIPYSDGWTAKVDGEEQELLQANTMYMALYLDTGEHEIELTYQTPGMTAGLIITGVSAVTFAGLIILGEHMRRTRKSGIRKNQ